MSVKNNLDNLDVFIKSKTNKFGNLNLKTNNLKNEYSLFKIKKPSLLNQVF